MASSIKGFRALDVNTVVDYLAERKELATRVGPSGSHSSWQVQHDSPLLHSSVCAHGHAWNAHSP